MKRGAHKILIHTLVFSPDGVSTAYLYNDLALGLQQAGYDVVVLTTTPHYNIIEEELRKQPFRNHLFGLYSTSSYHGIKVYHVYQRKYKHFLLRLLGFIFWHCISFIIGLYQKNVSFILSPSPPLSIGFVSIILAKIKRAKVAYNVQEIYPDFLINLGSVNSTFIINALKWLERFVYKNSDAVITIDQLFYNTIKSRIADQSKLFIIPNFVDTDLYKPLVENLNLPREFIRDSNTIKVLYAGNIGFFQDWNPVFYAANTLKDENIEFWIIGEGVKKDFLEDQIKSYKLPNVHIFPYQKRELIPVINNYVEMHFISINSTMEQEGFPSKVYTIMACAKPLIVVTGEQTPLYNFLRDKDCAELIVNDRNIKFVQAVRKLARDKELRERLGNNGYREIHKGYSKKVVVAKYVDLIRALCLDL